MSAKKSFIFASFWSSMFLVGNLVVLKPIFAMDEDALSGQIKHKMQLEDKAYSNVGKIIRKYSESDLSAEVDELNFFGENNMRGLGGETEIILSLAGQYYREASTLPTLSEQEQKIYFLKAFSLYNKAATDAAIKPISEELGEQTPLGRASMMSLALFLDEMVQTNPEITLILGGDNLLNSAIRELCVVPKERGYQDAIDLLEAIDGQ